MRENRPYGSEGGASQTNGTSLPLSLGRRSRLSHTMRQHTGFNRHSLCACPPLTSLRKVTGCADQLRNGREDGDGPRSCGEILESPRVTISRSVNAGKVNWVQPQTRCARDKFKCKRTHYRFSRNFTRLCTLLVTGAVVNCTIKGPIVLDGRDRQSVDLNSLAISKNPY